jgi:hypothetical protein
MQVQQQKQVPFGDDNKKSKDNSNDNCNNNCNDNGNSDGGPGRFSFPPIAVKLRWMGHPSIWGCMGKGGQLVGGGWFRPMLLPSSRGFIALMLPMRS